MKYYYPFLLIILCAIGLMACKKEEHKPITIGIIKPLEHKALDEIVAGFSSTMQLIYEKPVVIKVENAQNDANLERAILQKMRDQKYDLIVPIGLDVTQMALSLAPKRNILSLASDLSEANRLKLKHCQVAVVHDEISPVKLIQFISAIYPKLSHITLVHSSANKVLPQVEATIKAAKAKNIQIHPLMILALPELYSAAQALPANTEAILVLKDHLIVSGIGTLAKVAAKKHIPLISSDEGSVETGAGFALGVKEKDIGAEGAKLATSILRGMPPCELPIVDMKNLTVFANRAALEQENQNLGKIAMIANNFNHQLITVGPGN